MERLIEVKALLTIHNLQSELYAETHGNEGAGILIQRVAILNT